MDELATDALTAARTLLGWKLVRELDGKRLAGWIVETEAYDQADAASHSYKGETPRTKAMFGPAGHAYVYFTYGMHYCFNVVAGTPGHGCGVLIRALEPLEGIELMKQNRDIQDERLLTSGPAKLCYALKIDKSFGSHDLTKPPLYLEKGSISDDQVVQSTRIGISKEKDKLWRFYVRGNPYVSKL